MKNKLILLLMLILLLGVQSAGATMVDLTTYGSEGTINSAWFKQIDLKATGSGNIDSFVQIGVGGNLDIIEAYNTTQNNVLDNGPSNVFNHELKLSAVPSMSIYGGTYREFLLDVHQNQAGTNGLVSLDEIQLFLSNTPNQSVETFNGSGVLQLADASLIYRLDGATANNYIKLDSGLNPGQGWGDMYAYFPENIFTGGYKYVYLYSRFGEVYPNNANFEEWAVKDTTNGNPIPEPGTLILLGSGLVGLLGLRRKRS